MTEIKLTKRYPLSRTEDITDAYMRGWNDALDAVQNGKFHIADTPQTDCGDFADRLAYERGVKHAWEVAQKVFDSTVTFYEAEDVAKQIDKDINVRSKDEPQTETEIAKAIVHKMIDDAVIAEDAYPDLRQKMHDAVDEYEPQIEREGE